ncbi:hypothetical protein [uncultured Methylibium sp.]|uniref:hypothetical protein n=1 Tax=uncultured Methylibium sp. TaxID=381093 RepID=UPI0025DA1EB6|nr:hypothetical protein [uncultured Methylibium sp.]
MSPVSTLSLAMLLPYLGLIAWQRLVAARPLPLVRGWELRAGAVLAGYVHLSPYLPPRWSHVLAVLPLESTTVITLAL